MISTQPNAHVLLKSELKGPSPNLLESCRANPLVINMNRGGQSVDNAPIDSVSVKEAIGKFKGLVKWDNNSPMPAEDGSRSRPPAEPSPHRMARSESLRTNPNAASQIDTAAPIKPVRATASRFSRSISQPNSPASLERQKSISCELEKLQEELVDRKKESEAAEESKEHVITKLASLSMLVRELKLSLEKEESRKDRAQQDCEIAERRLLETKLEISRSSIYARSWSELHVAKGRVEDELSSAKRELEAAEVAHGAAVAGREAASRKASEYNSQALALEKKMEHLRSELSTTKESTELARAAYIGAVESKVAAASGFELQRSVWEMEAGRANVHLAELEAAMSVTNDLRSRVESSSDSLRVARSKLKLFVQGSRAREKELELELETTKRQIEKTKGDINHLQVAVSPLRSAIGREKIAMAPTKENEASTSAVVLVLDGEIESTEAEIEMVLRREKLAREKAEDLLPEVLEQAKEEADRDKSSAKTAREAARKTEAEAELTKASATVTEKRLDAAVKETQAAKASARMASSSVTAMKHSRHVQRGSKKGVDIPVEEYLDLRRKAGEAEELARNRVTSAAEQVKEAKESERKVQQELGKVMREIQERRRALSAEVAELREWKPGTRHGPKMKAMINMMRTLSGPVRPEDVPAARSRGTPETTPDGKIMRSKTMGMVGDDAAKPTSTNRKSKMLPRTFSVSLNKKKTRPPS